MTRTLFVYWQHLTQRTEVEAERAEAPVLDLDVCFGAAGLGHPVIAAHRTADVTRFAERGADGAALI